jgi:FlaA1/EpsC-like NDP-sugar epimerase
VTLSGARIDRKQLNHIQNETKTTPCEIRLKTQIDDLRKDTGQVQQAQNGKASNRLQKQSAGQRKKYTYTPNTIQIMLTSQEYLTPLSKGYL